jgi:hypothetical protein
VQLLGKMTWPTVGTDKLVNRTTAPRESISFTLKSVYLLYGFTLSVQPCRWAAAGTLSRACPVACLVFVGWSTCASKCQ